MCLTCGSLRSKLWQDSKTIETQKITHQDRKPGAPCAGLEYVCRETDNDKQAKPAATTDPDKGTEHPIQHGPDRIQNMRLQQVGVPHLAFCHGLARVSLLSRHVPRGSGRDGCRRLQESLQASRIVVASIVDNLLDPSGIV